MLRAIATAKKKNDHIDANKICDCLRCDFLSRAYLAAMAIRERRRTLRYRNLLVHQTVQMKIKISTPLTEAGVSYNKSKLHNAEYFPGITHLTPLSLWQYRFLFEPSRGVPICRANIIDGTTPLWNSDGQRLRTRKQCRNRCSSSGASLA
ncbi:MAG TPA: hypothetical protein VLV88_06540 [Terriglobales bacterium]|nr:hypothetical protein [Terriglobales bacterium]